MVRFTTVNLGSVALRSGDFDAAVDYAAEAVELFRATRDDTGVAVSLDICGWAALGQLDSVRAEGFFREMVVICGPVGWLRGIAGAAVGLGVALIGRHHEERGVQLLACAACLREELGVDLKTDEEKRAQEEAVATAKAALGEDAFARAWARGEAMTPEQVVAFTMPA